MIGPTSAPSVGLRARACRGSGLAVGIQSAVCAGNSQDSTGNPGSDSQRILFWKAFFRVGPPVPHHKGLASRGPPPLDG